MASLPFLTINELDEPAFFFAEMKQWSYDIDINRNK